MNSQSNSLTVATQPGALHAFRAEQVDLIRRTVAKDATDAELLLFLYQATKAGLDPLAKQIYFRKHRNRKSGEETVTILTGIDGYRLIADRTGSYAGNDDPVFDDEQRPGKATVTVYKIVGGVRCAYTASARWEQYYPGDAQGFMWNKMPHLMLGKCAEALALRKAFPAELAGMHVKEEMDQVVKEAVIVGEGDSEIPKRGELPDTRNLDLFDRNFQAHRNWFEQQMRKYKVQENVWGEIATELQGKPLTEMNRAAKIVSDRRKNPPPEPEFPDVEILDGVFEN